MTRKGIGFSMKNVVSARLGLGLLLASTVALGGCATLPTNGPTAHQVRKGAEKNVYTYECENEICDPNVTRTIVEVPKHLDNSTRRAEELPYYSSEPEEAPSEPEDAPSEPKETPE